MKIRKLIIVIGLVFSLLTSMVVAASDEFSSEDLSQKTFDEIIEVINENGANIDMNYVVELKLKIKTVSEERILEEVLDKDNSLELRQILLEFSFDEKININFNELKKLLFDENEEFIIKYIVLYRLSSSEEDLEILEKIAESENERLAFHAMRHLMLIDLPKAVEIANEVLDGYSGPVGYKVRASVMVKAKGLAQNPVQEEIIELIALCDRLMYDEYEDDPVFIDTVGLDLAEIKNIECVNYILRCDKMDYTLKWNCFHKNTDIVGGIIGDVNEDKYINAVDALYILQEAASLAEFDSYQSFVGDVNGDEAINAKDALMVLQSASKIIDSFPVM